jgi:hypothetical protein
MNRQGALLPVITFPVINRTASLHIGLIVLKTLEAEMKMLEKALIDDIRAHFRGDVLVPGDSEYDEVRQIWNAMIDRRPALIARCCRLKML